MNFSIGVWRHKNTIGSVYLLGSPISITRYFLILHFARRFYFMYKFPEPLHNFFSIFFYHCYEEFFKLIVTAEEERRESLDILTGSPIQHGQTAGNILRGIPDVADISVTLLISNSISVVSLKELPST